MAAEDAHQVRLFRADFSEIELARTASRRMTPEAIGCQ